MVRDYTCESLAHDPIHGYIPFISKTALPTSEVVERDLIDHPWLQRLRKIYQLQTARWVFPTAEHTRFPHSLGAMHLASRAVEHWYESLQESCPDVPSYGYVQSLVRMAALLHDVGHGPYGHFFDDHFLSQFDLTHEDLGVAIIEADLAPLLRNIRRSPYGELEPSEELDPDQIAYLIRRPRAGEAEPSESPAWLGHLRALFSGIYTVDNMDFVLRDAYMTGYSTRAFDLSRLLHYSFFTPSGLTVHARGLPALINFIEVRANLFRTIYFHRTVRALDIALGELFAESMQILFPRNPIENLAGYAHFSEFSLLVDVERWADSEDSALKRLGEDWRRIVCHDVTWEMAAERTLYFHAGFSEQMTIYSEPELLEKRVREKLPSRLREIPLTVDVARHYHRPSTRLPAGGQNFLFDPVTGQTVELTDDRLFREIPLSSSICRVYTHGHEHHSEIHAALGAVLDDTGDATTNM